MDVFVHTSLVKRADLLTLDERQSLQSDLVPLDDRRMMADHLGVVGDGVNVQSVTFAAVGH